MNGNRIVVDTNIIIYHLNGDSTIESLLEGKEIIISFITEIELRSYPNLSKEKNKVIEHFLRLTQKIHSNSAITEIAIKLRFEKKLKTPDAIIAATALFTGAPLLSADRRLSGIPDLDIIKYSPTA